MDDYSSNKLSLIRKSSENIYNYSPPKRINSDIYFSPKKKKNRYDPIRGEENNKKIVNKVEM